MYKFISLKTTQLSNSNLNKILKLKDFFWQFGKYSQLKWFKKNIKKNDIHNLLFFKKNLIGYTCLRKKKLINNKIRINCLLLDTFIIHPSHRKKKLSKILMKKNNFIIKKKKLISILLCSKKLENFYIKFNWQKIPIKKFNLIGVNLRKKLILTYNNNLKFNF